MYCTVAAAHWIDGRADRQALEKVAGGSSAYDISHKEENIHQSRTTSTRCAGKTVKQLFSFRSPTICPNQPSNKLSWLPSQVRVCYGRFAAAVTRVFICFPTLSYPFHRKIAPVIPPFFQSRIAICPAFCFKRHAPPCRTLSRGSARAAASSVAGCLPHRRTCALFVLPSCIVSLWSWRVAELEKARRVSHRLGGRRGRNEHSWWATCARRDRRIFSRRAKFA